MTSLVLTFPSRAPVGDSRAVSTSRVRASAVAVLAMAAALVPHGIELAAAALADAYLQVSVFVAATLAVIYAAEGLLRADVGALLSRYRGWQVPAAALLGALPGCGGAIVAVTQHSRGVLSFGALVATLTSTMGDAMFLLLAREPVSASIVLATGIVAGIVTGFAVDAIHGPRSLRPATAAPRCDDLEHRAAGPTNAAEWLFVALLIPGLVLGVLAAFQIELDHLLVSAIGIAGSALAIGMWVRRGQPCDDCAARGGHAATRTARLVDETSFVTAWVVFAFVGYELLVTANGIDVGALFDASAAMVPALAVVAGLIPGCGIPIVTTSLYLEGAIPLSAQLGNALSNDGDALLPAIAKAPRAAALATLYSAIPATVVAYGAYVLGW